MNSKHDELPIVVAGAGLTGCCMSYILSQRFPARDIILIEARDDYRFELEKQQQQQQLDEQEVRKTGSLNKAFGNFTSASARSINLALSYRGICALKLCGLFDQIVNDNLLILMRGRMVHLSNGQLSEQLYGQEEQGIYSISRLALNCMFLDRLTQNCKNVKVMFKSKITKVDADAVVTYIDPTQKTKTLRADWMLGCDGAFSTVRRSLEHLGRHNLNLKYIEHGYKELTMYPVYDAVNNSPQFAMNENYLHIWPHHQFMLIALPNPDKTFTCTLFLQYEGAISLNAIDAALEMKNYQFVTDFFEKYFPDFVKLCPNYIQQCQVNPSSSLAHLHFDPWHYKDKILLLGDAAHAIVPFYGQGMNCGFEDCVIFDEYLTKFNANIGHVFQEFSDKRIVSCDALCKLSLQNYIEMRSLTAKTWFVVKKALEKKLSKYMPSYWTPVYSMVAFQRTPYHLAIEKAKRQDRMLAVVLTSFSLVACASLVMYKYNRGNSSNSSDDYPEYIWDKMKALYAGIYDKVYPSDDK